ncbi:hypothetical protein OK349_05885 [Sphingomonas sp. BT-65]|uniref:hypothetical protein n=1 Tax=Sphingomonas sp. BT-65 TaxID=2989821 RepID=UPI0022368F8C|nr:hypothetical protein [Sphingomonas sp. BT-65]MCW4461230.1 hypothetical protein [Sphingomonas sp. BT-65]
MAAESMVFTVSFLVPAPRMTSVKRVNFVKRRATPREIVNFVSRCPEASKLVNFDKRHAYG